MTPEQGMRLREERKRLNLTQAELGVAPKTQRYYEMGARSPDAAYLTDFAAKGGDLLYVIKGERTIGAVPAEEAELLEAWRGAGEPVKRAVIAALRAGK